MTLDELSSKINNFFLELQKPSLQKKATFFRLLAVCQKAWLGIRESLDSLMQGEEEKGMLFILIEMVAALTKGKSLADAMAEFPYFFNIDEIELVRSAEVTGNMSQCLEEIADSLEESQEIRAKIKKALTYPALVIGFTIIAVVVLLIFVLPTIIDMYTNVDEMPWITVFMLNASDYLKKYGLLWVLFIVIAVIVYNFLYANTLAFKIFIDSTLLKIPLVQNIIKLFYMSKFTTLLSQFYAAWVSPVVSFKMLADIFENFQYKKKMVEIRNSINSWFSIYESMEWSELFDPILTQIVNVWENTGALTTALGKISSYYTTSLKNSIDALMAVIEPLLMAFVACIVGVLLGAIYLPMADMVNQIGA